MGIGLDGRRVDANCRDRSWVCSSAIRLKRIKKSVYSVHRWPSINTNIDSGAAGCVDLDASARLTRASTLRQRALCTAAARMSAPQ